MTKREIVKCKRFEAALETLFETCPRGDEAIVGLEWILHHIAELGTRVHDTELFCWPIIPDDGQVYIAYYTLERHRVILRDLVRRNPLPPEAFTDLK